MFSKTGVLKIEWRKKQSYGGDGCLVTVVFIGGSMYMFETIMSI
jgi:hypothetical protein